MPAHKIPDKAVRGTVLRARVPEEMAAAVKYLATSEGHDGSVSTMVYHALMHYLRRKNMWKPEWYYGQR